MARSAGTFGARLDRALERWGGFLDELLATGRRVALWGAGSKGVTFLNLVEGGDRVDAVVDVNPRKHGLHVPGTGQAVVAPETLGEDPVDVVLVMNPLYEDEIRARLDGVGVAADVVTVTGER
ncbi:MAG: hypothetical protein M5U14_00810 [Acidimicrobiia bacterium]|nr:hypothetical protein [Acidimicrobiia bacterium]